MNLKALLIIFRGLSAARNFIKRKSESLSFQPFLLMMILTTKILFKIVAYRPSFLEDRSQRFNIKINSALWKIL